MKIHGPLLMFEQTPLYSEDLNVVTGMTQRPGSLLVPFHLRVES